MTKQYKVAYLVSHPIQYQAPLLRYIAAHSCVDLTAFFLSDFSVRGYQDPGFGTTVQWDVPLIEGYDHVFLPAWGGTERVTALKPWTTGLHKHLKSGGFDALWLHGYTHPSNLRAMLIAKQLGMKVLLRSDIHLGSALGSGWKRRLKEAVVRRLFTAADGFLAVGSLNREYYLHYGVPADKIFLMPYAVDNEFFHAKSAAARSDREALRAQLGLAPGRSIILYASRFIKRKRVHDLWEAYRHLSPDGLREPTPYLLLVGDGEERTALEARVRELGWDSVKFVGFKNQTELPAFFDLCDVFALVPEREPWALIVNEVMNAAKPVILSDQVGAAPDLVRDGENGFVLSVGDTSALTDRLRRLTSAPALAAEMGENSLKIIRQWSFRENVEALEEALDAVLGAEKKGRTRNYVGQTL